MVSKGLGLEQMVCLDHMWTHESNWRTTAKNASSGSYGIPQALPASKMGLKSEDGASDYLTNPATQIRWGIWYATSRYGSPCQALDVLAGAQLVLVRPGTKSGLLLGSGSDSSVATRRKTGRVATAFFR